MSVDPTRLILVRHGEPDEAMRGRCYGSVDVGLSKRGREQSRRLAQALAPSGASAVFSSPLGRAQETAQPIVRAIRAELRVRRQLREMSFGEFEGRRYEEIAAETPELYSSWMGDPETVTPPGGESFLALRARASAEVRRIRDERNGTASIVVSHSGVIRAVLADVLELKPRVAFRIQIDWASVTIVDWYEETAVVRLVNGRADPIEDQKGRFSLRAEEH